MEVERTNDSNMTTEAQILESYTNESTTEPDQHVGTELYQLNLHNGETVFCLPKSKKLADIVHKNSPNQEVTATLISAQQGFTSLFLFLLGITILICMVSFLPLGELKLVLVAVTLVLIGLIMQLVSTTNDITRRIESTESNSTDS